MQPRLPFLLQEVLEAVRRVGHPYLVGGCVRDWLLGLEPKDIDIEVFGTGFERLRKTLARFGPTDVVGKSFGVVKLRLADAEYDFSLPRRERKTGKGHCGFAIRADPSMTVKEASSRRDFTINAMAYDPEAKTLIDPHGGRRDLENKILRHVGPAFAEDPLRVLRGFQLAGRHDLSLAAETAGMGKQIFALFAELPKERIWGEWEKWASLSVRPSKGIAVLLETEWIRHFPALAAMKGIPQDPQWHPEGDVLTHTLHCLDALGAMPEWRALAREKRRDLMFAVLAHDFGKAETTHQEFKHGRLCWTSPGHDRAGVAPARSFLEAVGAPAAVAEIVVPLVENHMAPLQLTGKPSPSAVRRLARRLQPASISDLAILVAADSRGRPPLPGEPPESMRVLLETARELRVRDQAPKPIIQGRHLIGEGMVPGPRFKPLLNELFEAQLEGAFQNEAEGIRFLRQFLGKAGPRGQRPEGSSSNPADTG